MTSSLNLASNVDAPLLGDGMGVYRVHFVGNSGVGKSTVAARLAAVLGVPHIPLDELHWGPGWTSRTHEVLRSRVDAAMCASPQGWVIDGQYRSALGDSVSDAATDVIWLDPPLALYFPRLLWRTLLRLLRLAPPCAPGCPERVGEAFFSRKSIIWWCLSNHWRNRRRLSELYARIGIERKGGKMRRLGGWGSEFNTWWAAVERMYKK